MRKGALRRLSAALGLLDPSRADDEGADDVGVDELVEQVERSAAVAARRLADTELALGRLMAAMAEIAQGVVVCDPDGAVVYRNTHAAMFVGARHGEALAEQAVAELLQAAIGGASPERTVDLFSPPRRTLVVRATPLVGADGVLGAVAVIEDVSEKRRLDMVRRDFVANISHELKTPVGALSLVAETLCEEDDPAIVARLAGRMRAESERLGRIIEDLLDLSRIEAEETPIREHVAVRDVVAQAVDRLRPTAEHRGIALELDEVGGALQVRGDRRQLVSALHNLLDNAIKYSERGSAVQVRATGADGWVEIVVADHGIGIPSRDLERIFERFYRVDQARSRETGGTGLGLAIVRHVAGNHGGEVQVASREGDGSTFTLRLPGGAAAVPLSGVGGRDEHDG